MFLSFSSKEISRISNFLSFTKSRFPLDDRFERSQHQILLNIVKYRQILLNVVQLKYQTFLVVIAKYH